jgi:starch phosphorylase
VRTTICKDFVEFYGVSKFGNVTNGSASLGFSCRARARSRPYAVTPRRWLDQCNPGLSKLITDTLKIPKEKWLKDLPALAGLLQHTEDPAFRKKWAAVKQSNKERLAQYVATTLGAKVNTQALFDVQIKRLHEYKRQTLNIFGVIHVSAGGETEAGAADGPGAALHGAQEDDEGGAYGGGAEGGVLCGQGRARM